MNVKHKWTQHNYLHRTYLCPSYLSWLSTDMKLTRGWIFLWSGTGIKFKVFDHNSFMSAICFMFSEAYGLYWSFKEINFLFFSLLPSSSCPPLSSFLLKRNILETENVNGKVFMRSLKSFQQNNQFNFQTLWTCDVYIVEGIIVLELQGSYFSWVTNFHQYRVDFKNIWI